MILISKDCSTNSLYNTVVSLSPSPPQITNPEYHRYNNRKAVRATLILIPLLGLHYILTPFRPEAKSEWEGIYESIAAVCTSFQGLCVAMLFCFCNAEVITVIKKKLKDTFNLSGSSFKRKKRSNSASGGGGNGPYSTTTTLVNNCYFNDNNNNNNNSNNNNNNNNNITINNTRSLKSVISATNSLAQPGQQQQQAAQLGRSNGSNSNNSNSSSLLTNVTASPIQVNLNSATVSSLLRCSDQQASDNIDSSRKLDTAVCDLGQSLANNRRPSLAVDKEETVNLLQNQDRTTSFSLA